MPSEVKASQRATPLRSRSVIGAGGALESVFCGPRILPTLLVKSRLLKAIESHHAPHRTSLHFKNGWLGLSMNNPPLLHRFASLSTYRRCCMTVWGTAI